MADRDALNKGATDGAELAAQAVGNLELKVGSAQCSVGSEIIFHAGALITDSRPQHLLNRPMKALHLF